MEQSVENFRKGNPVSASNWTPEEVGELYDQACRMSGVFNNGQEHLGYWYDDSDNATMEEASQRLTRKVLDALGLRRGEHLLEAGCGVGAPATQFAEEAGARVTGVTISAVEAEEAEKRVAELGLKHRVSIQRADYHALPFPDGHFDALTAMESLMHSSDLDKALGEFHRVLRPGGRLAVTETVRKDSDSYIPDMYRSRVPMTIEDWVRTLTAAGFVVEEYTQCGHRVFSSGARYVARAEELQDVLVRDFGADFVEAIKQGYRDMFAPGPERMGYAILVARKPAA